MGRRITHTLATVALSVGLAVTGASVTASAAATPVPVPAHEASVTSDVAYVRNEGDWFEHLDVHAPDLPGPWPVVVVAHGGGESRGQYAALARAIASEGAVVFNVDWRQVSPFVVGIEQIACAVRFARARAEDHGGDPDRITLVGSSVSAVSGTLVAMAGDDLGGDCTVTEGSALPDALVAYEGPYDWAQADNPYPADLDALKDEDPDLWESIDPYSNIGGNPDLVVRLVHGADVDTQWFDVLPQVSVDFHAALLEAGYDVEMTVIPDASIVALTSSNSTAFEPVVQLVLQVARG